MALCRADLGDALLVRLPRQPGGSATIEKEARWLPVIAPGLTVAVPEVVAVGDPGFGYPERWSVTRWIDGQTPTARWGGPTNGTARGFALDLAQLVTELHQLGVPATAYDEPALFWYRGGRLADLDRDFRQSVEACRPISDLGLDPDRALDVWDDVLAADLTTAPRKTWYHGDLLAENLPTRDGELVAVLDFGGLALGDPAVDLIVAWDVLDGAGRQTFRRRSLLTTPRGRRVWVGRW